MARNFSTRLGSRTCKRPTRRTRRQSTWSPLGEKLHREWMTYYCWRCVHKTGTTPMMSTHGKVTDFQMWDEVLPDEQLLKVLEKNLAFLNSRFFKDHWLWRVPRGQPGQLGENQLVLELKSWHGLTFIGSFLHQTNQPTRLGRRLLTWRRMFVEAGTWVCTWCPTNSR